MEDKEYQCLEKKFHLLQEKHLRELCSENDVPYGSAAVICKAIVDKVSGIFVIIELKLIVQLKLICSDFYFQTLNFKKF